jgi:hypothetical protein
MSPRSRRTLPRSPLASRIQLNIHAEGQKSESQYLTHWNRLYRENAIISIATHEHTTPFELVGSAAAQRRQDLRNTKTGSEFDEYWCIFDVDEHPKLSEALDMAQANHIKIALSSPCLELWFLLHFENQTAYIERHPAQRRLEQILKCKKDLTQEALDHLVDNFAIAKRRAQALAFKHEADGSERPWNPYSDVWKLVDIIMNGTLQS